MLDIVNTDRIGAAALSPALQPIHTAIEGEQRDFIARQDDAKRAGYFCAYTPPELLNAAGLRHARLFKAGDAQTVSQGEHYTQSVFCDFSKSCIGAFDRNGGDPFYLAVDKLYNFHTCASMKRASEVIEQFVPTTLFNLPRMRNETASRSYFRDELLRFRGDAAALAGRTISDADVHVQIKLFNKARRLLRRLSELRKRANPPLTGLDFLELARGYFYLPPDRLVELYQPLYDRLSLAPDDGTPPTRLVISGSIMADGDRRLVDIIEGEIGARIVAEDHCAGLRPFLHELSETGDPFAALANGYLDQAPCARMKPLDDSLVLPTQLAEDYAAEGILYVYQKFCACYGITRQAFVNHFQDRGIPVLELSSDYSQSDHGQIKTRVEAFIEILNDRRNDLTAAGAIHRG